MKTEKPHKNLYESASNLGLWPTTRNPRPNFLVEVIRKAFSWFQNVKEINLASKKLKKRVKCFTNLLANHESVNKGRSFKQERSPSVYQKLKNYPIHKEVPVSSRYIIKPSGQCLHGLVFLGSVHPTRLVFLEPHLLNGLEFLEPLTLKAVHLFQAIIPTNLMFSYFPNFNPFF